MCAQLECTDFVVVLVAWTTRKEMTVPTQGFSATTSPPPPTRFERISCSSFRLITNGRQQQQQAHLHKMSFDRWRIRICV